MLQKYPHAVDTDKVGTYPAFARSGGGYFYDEVLEYRVWMHPEAGAKDLHDGEDYFHSFATHEEAKEFSENNHGAESPLALVLQKEHINEPKPGIFEHIKDERISEWQPDWLENGKRSDDSISKFLREHDS